MAFYLVYSLLEEANGEVKNLRDRLESISVIPGRIPGFESLGRGYFRKRLGSYRLLARLLTIPIQNGSYPVVVFVDYLHRGDRLYADAPAEEMRARYEPRIEQELPDIQKYVAKYVDSQRSTSPLRPLLPPPSSLVFLLDRIDPPELDTTIYESECWVSSQRKLETYTERAEIYQLLKKIAGEKAEPGYDHQSQNVCQVHYYRLNDPEHPLQHIFLLGILSDRWPQDDLNEMQRQIEVSRRMFEQQVIASLHERRGNRKQFVDSVSRLSSRAYPSYLLADEELWQSVRDQPETFLALSTEEINVLSDMREGRCLPCVIEGRAGSGKSTLLIYHTADRLSRSRSDSSGTRYRLLFVTQSKSLVEKSQELIEKLKERFDNEYGQQQPLLQAEFKTFHAFALEQLPEERKGRFQDRSLQGGWINFNRFCDLLRGQGEHGFRDDYRNRANAEAVWFTLRSYIKGFNIHALDDDRWMSLDEYREDVPRKDRQVSEELYENVWKRVWPWYKRLTIPCPENDGLPPYWDDLDLAWEVLRHRKSDAPDYAVIVCDEVQDLTRVELAALLQALTWGRYDLSALRPFRLPIVMAGDAHQTVNPACFRWARVRTDIAKALAQQVQASQDEAAPLLDVQPLELKYNYRNAHAIALLCNAIQQLRQTTLGHRTVLQKPWREADTEPNQRIRRLLLQRKEDAKWFEDLKSVWLVAPEPTDPEIKSAREFWDALGVHLTRKLENCDTPMTIKGLEQPFVALIGFGTRFAQLLPRPELFWSWQGAADDPNVAENDRFAIEYFLNRLYVAASRAQEQLWIIETEEGWKAFWEPFEQWLKQQYQNEDADKHSIFGFHYSNGDLNELLQVDKKSWPELAKQSEQLAHQQRDANHAERAAFYYGRMGENRKSAEMRAYQEYYQGNIREAARRMAEMGNGKKAGEWYWEAAAWDELVRAGVQDCQHSIAQHMHQAPETRGREWVVSLLRILENPPASEELINARRVGGQNWSTWQRILLELLSEAVRLPQTEKDLKIQVEECLSTHDRRFYGAQHFRDWQRQRAQLAFQLEMWKEAVERWEAINDTKSKEYYLAKARSTDYPESLQWWESANEWTKILQLWNADAQKDRLDRKDLQRVLRAYRETRQWNDAFKIAVVMDKDVDDKDIAVETWRAICSHGQCSEDDLIRIIDAAFDALTQRHDKKDLPRCWTATLYTLLRATVGKDSNSQKNDEEPVRMQARALVYGVRHAIDHRGITSRLESAWNKGPKEPAWTSESKLLKQIVQHCRSLVEREWQQRRFEEAARLAYLVLHLLWNFIPRSQDRSPGDDVPRDQTEWRPYLQISEKVASVNYLAEIEEGFHELVYQALECVGAGPPDWIRQADPRGDAISSRDHSAAAKAEEDRDLDTPGTILNRLLKIVDSLSYDLLKNLQDTRKLAQRPDDIAPVRWWLTVGRFIEQAPFRRRALDFYRELQDLAQEYHWDRKDQQKITERLQDYERRYEAWRRHRSEPSSRPTVVEPGQSKDSDILIVYCRSDRNGAVIQLKPDLDQIRFSPPNTGDQEPEIRFPDGLGNIRRSSDSKQEIIWSFPWHGRTVALQWNGQSRELLILADRSFVVSFRR